MINTTSFILRTSKELTNGSSQAEQTKNDNN